MIERGWRGPRSKIVVGSYKVQDLKRNNSLQQQIGQRKKVKNRESWQQSTLLSGIVQPRSLGGELKLELIIITSKTEHNLLYKHTQGTILCSRAIWYAEVKKSNKYFLNFRKLKRKEKYNLKDICKKWSANN